MVVGRWWRSELGREEECEGAEVREDWSTSVERTRTACREEHKELV